MIERHEIIVAMIPFQGVPGDHWYSKYIMATREMEKRGSIASGRYLNIKPIISRITLVQMDYRGLA
jgi:hypothetical protein